jgi:hypothetical protein
MLDGTELIRVSFFSSLRAPDEMPILQFREHSHIPLAGTGHLLAPAPEAPHALSRLHQTRPSKSLSGFARPFRGTRTPPQRATRI